MVQEMDIAVDEGGDEVGEGLEATAGWGLSLGEVLVDS